MHAEMITGIGVMWPLLLSDFR